MTMKRRLSLVLVAVALAAAPAWADNERAGTAAASFLTVGTGPGVLGMGGAALGRSGALELAGWNPGSLGWLRETTFEFSHANLDDETAQEWATIGGSLGGKGTHWAATALYQSEGTFDGRDASNNPIGSFEVATAAAGLHLAQTFGSNLAIGVGGKYVLDSMGALERGSGMTFDAGVAMRFGMLGIGAAAQNALGEMKYGTSHYPFPSNYGVGVALMHPSGVTAACDVNMPSTSYTNVRGGVEWAWNEHVAMRGGYRLELGATAENALSGPTFGTGFGARGLWLDYGFLLSGRDGGQHRVALSVRPGQLGWRPGDPFGQSSIPREFDDGKIAGPPSPKAAQPKKATKN